MIIEINVEEKNKIYEKIIVYLNDLKSKNEIDFHIYKDTVEKIVEDDVFFLMEEVCSSFENEYNILLTDLQKETVFQNVCKDININYCNYEYVDDIPTLLEEELKKII